MFNCHACGERGDIFHFVEKKHHKSFPEALEYLANFAGVTPTKPAPLARKELPECPATLENLKAEYPYKDETGEPLFSVFRFEADGHRKAIRQGHPREGKEDKIKYKLPAGVARIPYNLNKFKLYDTIFVTEGENKANELRRWMLLGTCNPGGAGKWQDEYSQYLKDKHVVILPDNDEPGRKHGRHVAESVLPVAASVKIVELPGLPAKGDLIDWKEAGHTQEEFLALVESTPPLSEVPASEEDTGLPFKLIKAADILTMTPPKWRIKDMLPETGLVVLYGPPGSAKSFLALSMALALARGDEEWLGFEIVEPCPVVYINLESSWGLAGRLTAWANQRHEKFPDGLFFITSTFDLLDSDYVEALIRIVPKKGLVIIDTLARATPGADENAAKDMGLIISSAGHIQTATEGIVLIVTHVGKDKTKGIRGHTSLLGAVDVSIAVEKNGKEGSLCLAKVKEGEDGIRKAFTLKQVVIGWKDEYEETTSCVVEACDGTGAKGSQHLTPSQRYGLESLAKAIETHGDEEDCVALEDWREVFYQGHTGDNLEVKKKAFQRARIDLAQKGVVKVSNDFYSIVSQRKSR